MFTVGLDRRPTSPGDRRRRRRSQQLDRRIPSTPSVLGPHPIGVVVVGSTDGSVEYRNRRGLGRRRYARRGADRRGDRKASGRGPVTRTAAPRSARAVRATDRRSSSAVVAAASRWRRSSFVDDISERRRDRAGPHRLRGERLPRAAHADRGARRCSPRRSIDADDAEVVNESSPGCRPRPQRASRTIDDLLELSEIESGVRTGSSSGRADRRGARRRRPGRRTRRSRGEIEIATIDRVVDRAGAAGRFGPPGSRRHGRPASARRRRSATWSRTQSSTANRVTSSTLPCVTRTVSARSWSPTRAPGSRRPISTGCSNASTASIGRGVAEPGEPDSACRSSGTSPRHHGGSDLRRLDRGDGRDVRAAVAPRSQ